MSLEQALLRPKPVSNDLPPPKCQKCAVKGCANTTKTVRHILHLHTCGQASYKVTQCNTCFELARAHQRTELCDI